ncbi:insulin-related peptide 1 [Helicoverpa armigera]|uniref:insulin-related peptide 1 n=1 Tax=Helicoverpa armigera TaxID=29058 RepID=UPI000B37FC0A|nr:insulin-related peptide 1-like [Helicoverpa armigera]WGD18924.1 insulin-like peptide 4 [Helicoverpa armigera]
MLKLLVVVSLVLVSADSQAAGGRAVLCGRQLSEAIATLCWPELDKRGWWPPAHHVLAGVRGKRGPVDECCLKACSIDELMGYC